MNLLCRCGFEKDNVVHISTAECNRRGRGRMKCMAPQDHHPFKAAALEGLTAEDLDVIADALRYAAEDMAERANFEDGRDADFSEAAEFRTVADKYSAVLAKLQGAQS